MNPAIPRRLLPDQSTDLITRSAYPWAMPRGRHALPEPPRSDVPLAVLAVLAGAAAIAAVWLVDDSLAVQVGVTGIVVVLVLAVAWSVRSTRNATRSLWDEVRQRRHELVEVQRELSALRGEHRELLLELRSLRGELTAATDDISRDIRAASDQRALMHDLLVPRQPVADPVYPSLHLPLVRAAFSAQLPSQVPADVSGESHHAQTDETSGSEAFPPRQLLDLTASEIARLRPAN